MNTPIKLTPLHTLTQRLGARFVEIANWRFPEAYTTVEQEIAAVRAGCGLADVTPHGKIQIEGEGAAAALREAFGHAPEAIGSAVATEVGHVYCLRQDQFYLSTSPGREGEALARIQAAIIASKLFVTATDLTQGLSDIRLIGPASPQVLSKVCGLNFDDEAFPNLTAKQSSLAKTRQLILRRDFSDPASAQALPAYTLIGAQSLGAYVWQVVMEAGREFGIRAVGVAALMRLEQG